MHFSHRFYLYNSIPMGVLLRRFDTIFAMAEFSFLAATVPNSIPTNTPFALRSRRPPLHS